MRDKEKLPTIVLAILCAFLTLMTIALFRYTGSITADFKKKEAGFAAKTTEYKNQLDALKTSIDEKIAALAAASDKAIAAEREIDALKSESEKIRGEFNEERRKFEKRSLELKQRLEKFETAPIESLIKEALEKEGNESVKRVLTNSLSRVELIREGKAVDLEPIVVTKQGAGEQGVGAEGAPKAITVVALDKKNKLIAINAGRREKFKEGDRITVMRNGKELASAEVIAVRYRVATAFIDQNRHNTTIKDIREGDEIVREK